MYCEIVTPSTRSTKMETRVAEIADGVYRFSTFVPEVGPTGLGFNQFLIVGDEPLLFHTGLRPAPRARPR